MTASQPIAMIKSTARVRCGGEHPRWCQEGPRQAPVGAVTLADGMLSLGLGPGEELCVSRSPLPHFLRHTCSMRE